MGVKKERGLNPDFINKIKSNDKIMGYFKELESKKLFVGIRNNYFNFYYKGKSAAKVELANKNITCDTSRKYYKEDDLTNSKTNPRKKVSIDEFNIDEIICGIDRHLNNKKPSELECQQNIIMANNSPESNSEWFCIDMEYVRQNDSDEISKYGRPDIIAVSRDRDKNSDKYKVALIELKIGKDSFGNVPGEEVLKLCEEKGLEKGIISVSDKNSFGSGILGHFSDFVRYLENPTKGYEKLIREICNMYKNYKELGLMTNGDKIIETDFEKEPLVVFLTYSGKDNDVRYVKDCFKRYLFNKKVGRSRCSSHNVQDMWDEKGNEYIQKFKYVFREGIPDSNIKTSIFSDLYISEAINLDA